MSSANDSGEIIRMPLLAMVASSKDGIGEIDTDLLDSRHVSVMFISDRKYLSGGVGYRSEHIHRCIWACSRSRSRARAQAVKLKLKPWCETLTVKEGPRQTSWTEVGNGEECVSISWTRNVVFFNS